MKKTSYFLLSFIFCLQTAAAAQNLQRVTAGHLSAEEQVLAKFVKNEHRDTLALLFMPGDDYDSVKLAELRASFEDFSHMLKERFGDSPANFKTLRKISRRVYRQLLLSYKPLAAFPEVMDNGSYDCLTGTLVFAWVLEQFGYDYQVRETNYHIFLTVNTPDREVLIESTERFYGFVSSASEITERMEEYAADNRKYDDDSKYTAYNFDLNRAISFQDLLGLMYYNEAVKYFNTQQFTLADRELAKSFVFYSTERNQMLYALNQQMLKRYSPQSASAAK